jgi:hypothetical protein
MDFSKEYWSGGFDDKKNAHNGYLHNQEYDLEL